MDDRTTNVKIQIIAADVFPFISLAPTNRNDTLRTDLEMIQVDQCALIDAHRVTDVSGVGAQASCSIATGRYSAERSACFHHKTAAVTIGCRQKKMNV